MPIQTEQLADGKVRVKYDTGETFEGDPIEVMNKMGDAHVSTKRWAQNIRAENENLKNQQLNPPTPQPAPAPANADELALQNYLLEQTAKSLGFKNGEEYRQRLNFVNQTTDAMNNNLIAESFMSACPEFPGSPEAIAKLGEQGDAMGWEYNQPNLMAAHLMCLRGGAYKPLTPEEINAAWAGQMQVASGTAPARAGVPPTPPAPQSPGQVSNTDPWQMSKDELTKKVLDGGGLGKALMDLPPGGTLGS